MIPLSHPAIVDGWFREISSQWPGQAMTLKVKEILHVEKSLYQDVLVFNSETYGNVLVLDGAIQCTERDEFAYQEMITHIPMASHPDPKHVLVIGGGDGGVIREVLKHKSVEKVTLCDIDEAVIRVSKEYLPAMSACYKDKRVEVHIGDGFKFLPDHKDSYDVIITDSSDPVGPAEALFKPDYFKLLKESLKKGGNISTQAECLWLHLPLMRELKQNCSKLFPVCEFAFTTIPTYPSGQISVMICSKEEGRKVTVPLRAVSDTRYYNSAIHKAAFTLPEFGRAILEEGTNVMPKFARPVVPKTTKKKVLLLGSGLVAGPAAEYITRHNHELTVGCRTYATAEALCADLPNASPMTVDVGSADALRQAIKGHEVVVSLVPYTYHAAVMQAALLEKCAVVTTSYINPQMRALEQQFIDAGLICFNEIGVDPGVDHLWAIKTISEVHKAGGKIKSFYSYCGGLPEPAASDNALGYKFSWSPAGVLMALNNDGQFLKDGQIARVDGKDLMRSARPYYFSPAYNLVCYPNRDSSAFKEFYGLEDVQNLVRGTLRYGGFCEVIEAWKEIGLMDDTPVEYLQKGAEEITWVQLMGKLLDVGATEDEILAKLKTLQSIPADQYKIITSKFRQLGLFSSSPVAKRSSVMRSLSALLEERCRFQPGEVDIVLLQHTFEIIHADGREETVTSTLETYGDRNGGPSAMAKLVGVPCGMAVQFILEGVLTKLGVHAPYDEEVCALFRERLEKEEGITMVEKTV
ncbi:spermidine synthase [Tremella mesenterica]|uniref:Spermidine synthase n=1 Tax=Tremella mesenterica TaxID=5217 RepID=A0A4Q1BVW9_TREME|nr:spermidine synthase [Tremella mesenterica]